jgi:hypothetical protein
MALVALLWTSSTLLPASASEIRSDDGRAGIARRHYHHACAASAEPRSICVADSPRLSDVRQIVRYICSGACTAGGGQRQGRYRPAATAGAGRGVGGGGGSMLPTDAAPDPTAGWCWRGGVGFGRGNLDRCSNGPHNPHLAYYHTASHASWLPREAAGFRRSKPPRNAAAACTH